MLWTGLRPRRHIPDNVKDLLEMGKPNRHWRGFSEGNEKSVPVFLRVPESWAFWIRMLDKHNFLLMQVQSKQQPMTLASALILTMCKRTQQGNQL
jgi:hypothetical protein